jgi:hypothetical protein
MILKYRLIPKTFVLSVNTFVHFVVKENLT